jgi:hypothetical protein
MTGYNANAANLAPTSGRHPFRLRPEERVTEGCGWRRLLIAAALLPIHGRPAEALLLWNWSYSGTGVSASGTFTTNDVPDGAGFYQIAGTTGADNGVTITGLQPTGTGDPRK